MEKERARAREREREIERIREVWRVIEECGELKISKFLHHVTGLAARHLIDRRRFGEGKNNGEYFILLYLAD